MATQQTFLNAYEITRPVNGSFSFVVHNNGLANKGTTTVSDNGTDNTAVLGDVANDTITVSGLNNSTSQYVGVGTVNGVQGVVIFDSQAGGKYYLLTSQTYTSTTLTGSVVTATGSGGVGTWTLAGTAPTTPVITTVGDNVGGTTGNVADGTVTDDNTLTLSGTAGAGSTVTLFNNGVQIGTTVAGTNGTWSFTTSPLANGSVSFTATATDTSGAVSGTSAARTATVDTVAPILTANVVATSLNASGTSQVTFTFSEVPTGFTQSDVTVTGGSLSNFQQNLALDPTGKIYTATYTPTAGFSGTGSVAVTAGSYTDAAGNPGGAGSDTVAVDAAPDADVVVDLTDASTTATTASIAFTLDNLDAGSTAAVTFTGSGGGSRTISYTSGGAKTADISGLEGDVTATVLVTDAAGNVAAGTGETLAGDPVCFMPGTLIAVPGGAVPVEALRIGDPVLTHDGRALPVRWLGRQAVSTRLADPLRVLPVRVRAGALGEGLPARDLLVSPCHALLLDGVLAQAGALVNGSTIRREGGVPASFTYWHVELADHALVLAEGVPAETFVDNVERLAFDNWAEHEALYGREAPVAEMALPRAKAARQVPPATRARLAARAEKLMGRDAAAAAA